MQVYINGISDSSLIFRIKNNCKVVELKDLIAEKCKISNDALNLSFGGKVLKDSLLLTDYNVISNSVINCEHINNGGNFNFIDVNNINGIKKIPIGKASRWKKYVPGLNLEGKCTNEKCVAYKKKVICQIGYANYNFENIREDDKIKCPMCKEKIMPLSCGFSKCIFKIFGKRIINGKMEEISDEQCKLVRKGYYSYDPDQTKIINWETLTIEVNEIPSNFNNGFYCSYIDIDNIIGHKL